MKNLSVRAQLLAGFGLVMAIFVGTSVLVSIQFSKNQENNRWTAHTYEVLLESQNALSALVNIETGQRGYLLAGVDSFLEPLRQGERDFKAAHDRLSTLTSDNRAQKERLRELYSVYESWKSDVVDEEVGVRRGMTQDDASFTEIVEIVRQGRGKSGMDSMRAILSDIEMEERELLEVRAAVEAESARETNLTLVASSIVGMAIGFLVAIFFSARLIRQLGSEPGEAVEVAQAISDGNLNLSVDEDKVPAGSVMAAIVKMAKQLNVIVEGIQSASGQVEKTSNELSISSEKSITELRVQKEEAEQVATAMNEMVATVGEVAKNTQDAAKATKTADQRVVEGGRLMESSVGAILNLHDDIEKSAEEVLKLENESREISTVLEVIRSIAEQTNLLALNAAIEAARAGDQGRGFAVVADEVRTLASKTHKSTEEIRVMIERLQSGVENVVATMDTSRSGAKSAVSSAKEMEANLSTIKSAVSDVHNLNVQIATAAEEQSLVAEEINKNVIRINEVTDTTVAALTQVDRNGNELKEQAVELKNRIAYFKS